ncbi:MAG: 1-aminocyclopropane-1-carboxylate deaminase/D-cysteine desulfhydrase [Bacteroidales bacterium]
MRKSELINKKLEDIPKLEMSLLPTPIHRLNNMSGRLATDIYCKRDDLTGFAFGGNKTRKLDYLVSDAIATGYDSLITFGAVQSNWCRMTATAGKVNGLDVYLVLAGGKPDRDTANLLLDRLAGANIRFIDSTDRHEIVEEVNRITLELKDRGRQPYFMPVGGSVARGSLGYIKAMAEILEYMEGKSMNFETIILASGSAGSQAGLVAGQVISGWKGRIVGMAVSRNKAEQEKKVFEITKDSLDLVGYEYDEQSVSSLIHVEDSYLGEGYRIVTPGCLEAIRDFVQYEGIFLDQVYTGKAAAGLTDYVRKGLIGPDSKVLFIHTGGNVQLFE